MGNRTRPQTARSGLYDKKFMHKNLYCKSMWNASGVGMAVNIAQDALIEKLIRDYISGDEILKYSIEKIEISKSSSGDFNNIVITIFCAKPSRLCRFEGMNKVDKTPIFSSKPDCAKLKVLIMRKLVSSNLCKKVNCDIRVIESNRPESNAELIANEIGLLLSKNNTSGVSRYIKFVTRQIQDHGHGILAQISGRINGAAIARRDVFRTGHRGNMRLATLSTHIDYSCVHVQTKSGILGVKVWVDKGGVRHG